MKNSLVHTEVVLDTRRAKKTGEYPIKLRLTHKRVQRYINLAIDCTPPEWEKINSKSPKGDFKERKLLLNALEKRAQEIIESLGDGYSFHEFQRLWYKIGEIPSDVYSAFMQKCDALKKEGRIKTAESYDLAGKSFRNYRPGTSWVDITPGFLKGYEQWMTRNGKSPNTTGIYLRNLKALFNAVIERGQVQADFYPFGRSKYRVPKQPGKPRALSVDELRKFLNYCIGTGKERFYYDMWVFSMFCGGMNYKDIALLRKNNLTEGSIRFVRRKTQKTSGGTDVTIPLIGRLPEIISRWGNSVGRPDDFLFPILSDDLSAEQVEDRIHDFIRKSNKLTKRISRELGLSVEVKTYEARHSFATLLWHEGKNLALIQELLGHRSSRTTEGYLKGLGLDTKRKELEDAFSKIM